MTITVNGMHCPHCEKRVEKAVSAVEGVTMVKASHERNEVVFEGGNEADVRAAITAAGYEVA